MLMYSTDDEWRRKTLPIQRLFHGLMSCLIDWNIVFLSRSLGLANYRGYHPCWRLTSCKWAVFFRLRCAPCATAIYGAFGIVPFSRNANKAVNWIFAVLTVYKQLLRKLQCTSLSCWLQLRALYYQCFFTPWGPSSTQSQRNLVLFWPRNGFDSAIKVVVGGHDLGNWLENIEANILPAARLFNAVETVNLPIKVRYSRKALIDYLMMIVKLYLDVVNIQNCVTIQKFLDLVLYTWSMIGSCSYP